MKLTPKLTEWLVANCDMKKDATEDEQKKATSDAMLDDKLSPAKYAELVAEEKQGEANQFDKRLEKIADSLEAIAKASEPKDEKDKKPEDKKDKKPEDDKKETPSGDKKPPSRMAKMISAMGGMPVEVDGDSIDVRVIGAVEAYDAGNKTALVYPERTKGGGRHAFAGQQIIDHGRSVDTLSERDEALAGVWGKFCLASKVVSVAGSAQRAWERMTEHEKSLLAYLADQCEWDDSQDYRSRCMKGYPGGIKALIDDSTSGGLEAAPIVFDDQVIETPRLFGELYSLVNEVPISRGRRIEAISTDQVSISWGGVDDSAISLFNTASYVTAFDTTIFRGEGSVRIGLDFMSDTPIDFNAHFNRQYGEAMLEAMDNVIATGNGSTQPEGILNKSGVTSVSFGGSTSLSNYQSLRFSVPKAEHVAQLKSTAIFCGTETSYSRAIGIPVGAADVRSVFGLEAGPNYDGYNILQRSYKINESLTNAQIFYAIMGRYRLYRRKGIAIRTSTEGDTLIRNNEMLIVVMFRFGGQQERGATVGLTTNAPA